MYFRPTVNPLIRPDALGSLRTICDYTGFRPSVKPSSKLFRRYPQDLWITRVRTGHAKPLNQDILFNSPSAPLVHAACPKATRGQLLPPRKVQVHGSHADRHQIQAPTKRGGWRKCHFVASWYAFASANISASPNSLPMNPILVGFPFSLKPCGTTTCGFPVRFVTEVFSVETGFGV